MKKIYVCCQRPEQYDEYTRHKLQTGTMADYICVTDPVRLTGMPHGITAVLLYPMYDAYLAIEFEVRLRSLCAKWSTEDVHAQ